MAMELRHLRYLLAVAEQHSFTRAAEELHISQPTLSQQIKQLERMVGVPLLDRGGRSVRLTDAGEAYAHHARRALRDLEAAERAVHDVADLSRGHLRLALTPTFTAYLLGPLLAAFHEARPGIGVQVREAPQDRIESGLLADEFDLGIAFHGPHLPGIAATPLFTELLTLVVSCAPGPPAAGAALPVTELADRRLALLSGDFATRVHVDAHLAAHGVRPRISVEANSVQALTELVRRTGLATVLPEAVTEEQPGLAPVPLDPPLPPRTVTLLRRDGAYESAAARAFAALAHELTRTRGYAPPVRPAVR
ncbi:transcriptional regulator CynR [Streptomyces sp. NBC_00249]|uniref:transcriptional regulator CynR n=1 Tax=Streptomyces sp. NBC_00249 TaxID=2975690 RepID=UPI0022525579|nr:transcriptional regulator CynR [Streptomyces sp. NBC_00249]MCX5192585.1 transcriptional regulator CynR [Streptomyces sp. NBC_00249]